MFFARKLLRNAILEKFQVSKIRINCRIERDYFDTGISKSAVLIVETSNFLGVENCSKSLKYTNKQFVKAVVIISIRIAHVSSNSNSFFDKKLRQFYFENSNSKKSIKFRKFLSSFLIAFIK